MATLHLLIQELDNQELTQQGVKILKSYLQYAETGQLTQVVNRNTEVNDFEVVISKILHEHGYQTVFQVAGIDVGVLHPERENEYILGIEYDGVYYHSAKSIRERERLRTEILASKGWKIHRIWSVDWFKNRETEINRLLQALSEEDKSIKVESLSR
ncbi:hypothetical protein QUF74_06725 [Candidatus Halobeggiatoa sp. HSG11]|nr:hypothetical protein [Candidatus Halobeggiatoa sp. HSG11]